MALPQLPMRFLVVRDDFQVACRPFEGMLTDDP